MQPNPILFELFSFIDKAKISGTLSFPYRYGIYDHTDPLVRITWFSVELTNKLIGGFGEEQFQQLAIEKANQTLNLINLDVLDSTQNIVTALDRYLSSIRDIDYKLENLKELLGEGICFTNDDDVKNTPPGNIHKLDFSHQAALVEFLNTKVLGGLRLRLEDQITLIQQSKKSADFFNLLKQKRGVFQLTELTHRQHALIRKYKIKGKYIADEFIRTEIIEQFGKGREKAIDSVNEVSDAWKKIKPQEIENILQFLSDYPKAKQAALEHIDKLNKNL